MGRTGKGEWEREWATLVEGRGENHSCADSYNAGFVCMLVSLFCLLIGSIEVKIKKALVNFFGLKKTVAKIVTVCLGMMKTCYICIR